MHNTGESQSFQDILLKLSNLTLKLHSSKYESVAPHLFNQAIKEITSNWESSSVMDHGTCDIQEVSKKWLELKTSKSWDNISRRDLRDFISLQEAFADSDLLQVVKQHIPLSKRLLAAVMRSYLNFWSFPSEEISKEWRKLLYNALNDPSLNKLPWAAFKHWRDISPWLLSSKAPKELARNLLYSSGPLEQVLSNYLKVSVSFNEYSVGNQCRLQLLTEWLESDDHIFYDQMDQALSYWINPKIDQVFLSEFIIKVNKTKNNDLIERVKNWFLQAEGYGDIRLNQHGRWYHISDVAKQVFTSWLSKEDLEFFFNMVLPDGRDPHGRKEFWSDYLPFVIRSRVLISPEDRDRTDVDLILLQMESDGKTLPGEIIGSSVFVMETKEAYILEFAKKGYAAYIYWINEKNKYVEVFQKIEMLLAFRSVSRLSAGSLRRSELPNLSTQDFSIRCVHYGPWQDKLRRWFNYRGIRP